MASDDYYENSFTFKAVTALRIAAGVVLTLAVLFAMAWLIDYGDRRGAGPVHDQHSLLFSEKAGETPARQPRTFFESLMGEGRPEEEAGPAPGLRGPEIFYADEPSAQPPSAAAPESAPVPGRPHTPAPGPAEHPAAPEMFTVQLGSFSGIERARHFSEDFAARGYRPFVSTIELPDGTRLHRVRVGRFATREEAMALGSRIEKQEKVSVFVTTQ